MTPKVSMILVEFDGVSRFLMLHAADGGLAVDSDVWITGMGNAEEVSRVSQLPLGPRWLACSVTDGQIRLSCGSDDIEERWQRAIWGTLLFHMSVTLYDAGAREIALTGAVFLARTFAKDVMPLFQSASTFGTGPAWVGEIYVLRDLPVVMWEIPKYPEITAIGMYPSDEPAIIHGVSDGKIIITVQISGDQLNEDTGVSLGDCSPEVAQAAVESIDDPEQLEAMITKHPEISVLHGAIMAHTVIRQLCSRAVQPIPGMILTSYGASRTVDE